MVTHDVLRVTYFLNRMQIHRISLFCIFCALSFLFACNPVKTVKSVVPGLNTDTGPEAGEKIHLRVAPEEAVRLLDEVAADNGWQMVSVGDQYDLQGKRGKYFRMETTRFIGGRKEITGVFFDEPNGCYVIVLKNESGLPEELVDPFLAKVKSYVDGHAKTE
ncbi:MAG: hypothetical protein AB7G75_13055 [Candidatus Binatia bacterium]